MKNKSKDKRTLRKLITQNKRLSIFLLLVVMFAGIGTAIWYYQTTAVTGLIISSDEIISFSDDFNVSAIDTSSSSYSKTETIQLINSDGDINFSVSIIESMYDVVDGCNASSDVTYDYKYKSASVSDGSVINVSAGATNFTTQMNATQFSCPATWNSTIVLEAI